MRICLRLVAALLLLAAIAVPVRTEAADLSSMAEVTGVRVGDGSDKTRIVVDATKAVSIQTMTLSNPTRVVADIKGAWLSPKVKKETMVGSRFVSKVRVAQFDKNTVRVVVETNVGKNNVNVFTLKGGPVQGRVVMDFGNLGPDSSGATVKLPDVKTPSATQPTTPPETKPETKPTTKPETKPETKPTTKPVDRHDETPAKTDEEKSDTDRQIDEITGLKGRVITIDAGHGGNDSGAIGPTGVTEKSVTLNIALRLQKLLEAEGATVYMTRTTDTEVSPKGGKASDIEELQARCDVANKVNSDIFVSIHNDSFTNGAAKGTTGYYYARGSAKSRVLADDIRKAVIDELGTESRGTQSCNFYVVKHTDMPATLVEVAFISNPSEEKILASDEGAQKAAQGIADGIADYFG